MLQYHNVTLSVMPRTSNCRGVPLECDIPSRKYEKAAGEAPFKRVLSYRRGTPAHPNRQRGMTKGERSLKGCEEGGIPPNTALIFGVVGTPAHPDQHRELTTGRVGATSLLAKEAWQAASFMFASPARRYTTHSRARERTYVLCDTWRRSFLLAWSYVSVAWLRSVWTSGRSSEQGVRLYPAQNFIPYVNQ